MGRGEATWEGLGTEVYIPVLAWSILSLEPHPTSLGHRPSNEDYRAHISSPASLSMQEM